MAGDTGPTTQEVDYLNRVLSGGGGGEDAGANSYNQAIGDALRAGGGQQAMPDYSAMRNQIAQTMVSRGGGGAGGDPYAALRASMASRQPAADPYAALRASMASRQPAADPYAAYRAALASRAQPAAGGGAASHAGQWYDSSVGIGENPWKTGTEPNRMAEALAWQEANPFDQYFAPKGPMSGSGDDMNWQMGLQPGQGGASGALTGTGMNTTGFLLGGVQRRADPNYWGFTPGTGWGTANHAQMAWEMLRRANPATFEQYGGDAGMAAGVAAGVGPGEGGGSPSGVSSSGGGSPGGGGGGGTFGGSAGSDTLGQNLGNDTLGYAGTPSHFGDTFGNFGPSMGDASVSVSNGLAPQGGDTGEGTVGWGGYGGAPY